MNDDVRKEGEHPKSVLEVQTVGLEEKKEPKALKEEPKALEEKEEAKACGDACKEEGEE